MSNRTDYDTTPNILYISYDGMLEPLGQSQVLSYLEKLSKDYNIHLISFEKPADWGNTVNVRNLQKRIQNANISWRPLVYHKRPSVLATAWDILVGTIVAIQVARHNQIKIVHARSYVPALMSLPVKKFTKAKFLFDIRGFWVDERVDGGIWPKNSKLYRISKRLERKFFQSADHIVTLTHASAKEIKNFSYLKDKVPPITVIPTCANLQRFCPSTRQDQHTESEPYIFGYLGSAGTWYLFDEVLKCFKAFCSIEPNTKMLIVNRGEHDYILDRIKNANIDLALIEITEVEHSEVPNFIRRMTIGTALIKPVYSKISSAPTKLAEYLGCGIPCIGNVGIGDMKEILEDNNVGVVLNDFSDKEILEKMKMLTLLIKEPTISNRCTVTAGDLFSIEMGVSRYIKIYSEITIK